MSRHWPLASMLAGFVLMVASFFAPSLVPAAGAWTDADQQALTQAFSEWHHASHAHDHSSTSPHGHAPQPASHIDEAAAARAEYERQQAKLHAAQNRDWWVRWSVRLTGVLLAAAGIAGYVRGRLG